MSMLCFMPLDPNAGYIVAGIHTPKRDWKELNLRDLIFSQTNSRCSTVAHASGRTCTSNVSLCAGLNGVRSAVSPRTRTISARLERASRSTRQ
jgi:hypothetical protein